MSKVVQIRKNKIEEVPKWVLLVRELRKLLEVDEKENS